MRAVRTTRPAGLSTLLHLEGVYTIKNVLDWVKSASWCAQGGWVRQIRAAIMR